MQRLVGRGPADKLLQVGFAYTALHRLSALPAPAPAPFSQRSHYVQPHVRGLAGWLALIKDWCCARWDLPGAVCGDAGAG